MTKQTDRDFHSQNCAITNIRTSMIFVAFCGLEAFLSWRVLGNAFPEYNLLNVLRDFVVIAVCAKFLLMFRCSRERFVVSLVILRYVIGLTSASMPTVVNRVAGLVRIGDFALWVLALIVSLSMLVQAARSPNAKSQNGKTTTLGKRLVILFACLIAATLLGTLLYLVPSR